MNMTSSLHIAEERQAAAAAAAALYDTILPLAFGLWLQLGGAVFVASFYALIYGRTPVLCGHFLAQRLKLTQKRCADAAHQTVTLAYAYEKEKEKLLLQQFQSIVVIFGLDLEEKIRQ
eukprot:scaffold56381_cov20-Tisochrysis_lutea.AAC.2